MQQLARQREQIKRRLGLAYSSKENEHPNNPQPSLCEAGTSMSAPETSTAPEATPDGLLFDPLLRCYHDPRTGAYFRRPPGK